MDPLAILADAGSSTIVVPPWTVALAVSVFAAVAGGFGFLLRWLLDHYGPARIEASLKAVRTDLEHEDSELSKSVSASLDGLRATLRENHLVASADRAELRRSIDANTLLTVELRGQVEALDGRIERQEGELVAARSRWHDVNSSLTPIKTDIAELRGALLVTPLPGTLRSVRLTPVRRGDPSDTEPDG
jgi:hypothetical protein